MRTCLAFWALCSTALAQITVPATTPPYEPIVAKVEFPAQGDSKAIWYFDKACKGIKVDPQTVHIWGPPGKYPLRAMVITISWETKSWDVVEWEAIHEIGGAPVVPTPVDDPPGPLAVALGAGVDRLFVAAFFRDLADVVQLSTTIKTTGQFREAQRVAVATLKEVKRFPDSTPELNKQISDRIAAAVGLDDVQMDSIKRAALVAALRKIAEDF